jgi:release factor glutamine methyltransferase
MSEPTTIKALIDLAERVLSDSTHIFEDHDNRMEAEELMEKVLGTPVDSVDPADEVPKRSRDSYLALVARRAGGEPLPFIMGFITFYGLELKVKPGAFVPRPSSELTVDRAVARLRRRRDPVVVDVCTGAGPIAIAIASEREDADVWGTDISEEGLIQGRRNAKRLGIPNVNFRRGDMYGALPNDLAGRVNLITGHVPYVPPDELDDLPSEVREFEPIFTLSDASADGLGLMREAVYRSVEWLRPGGWLLLEMSDDLEGKVTDMCLDAGFEDIVVSDDEDGLSIVVEARFSRNARSLAVG